MNEMFGVLSLRNFMNRPDGWGRSEGREVYNRLLDFVEGTPGTIVFKVSLEGVRRLDMSFASETLVELARRYRRTKGFCLIDLADKDIAENIDAAAERKDQPLLIWEGKSARVIGANLSEGTREAFQFAMGRPECRAAEFATQKGISIANASMKFKQLWNEGFLLRRESVADSGGVEFVYQRIG